MYHNAFCFGFFINKNSSSLKIVTLILAVHTDPVSISQVNNKTIQDISNGGALLIGAAEQKHLQISV